MKLDPTFLKHKHVGNLLQMLDDAGADAWMVGGCVRDTLLGKHPKDIDVCTTALPEEVMEIFGGRAKPTGIAHGTITVNCGGHGDDIEVTTLRKDVATDGRRAAVTWAHTIEEDAQRRDFTFNALYLSRDGELSDPTGRGLVDLMQNRVRFIGDMEGRLREDYLRILRFYRFHVKLGVEVSPEDHALVMQYVPGLYEHVSKERVWMETVKTLAMRVHPSTMDKLSAILCEYYGTPSMTAHDHAEALWEWDTYAQIDPLVKLHLIFPHFERQNMPISRSDARRLLYFKSVRDEMMSPALIGLTALDAADMEAACLLRLIQTWQTPNGTTMMECRETARLHQHWRNPMTNDMLERLEVPNRFWSRAKQHALTLKGSAKGYSDNVIFHMTHQWLKDHGAMHVRSG